MIVVLCLCCVALGIVVPLFISLLVDLCKLNKVKKQRHKIKRMQRLEIMVLALTDFALKQDKQIKQLEKEIEKNKKTY